MLRATSVRRAWDCSVPRWPHGWHTARLAVGPASYESTCLALPARKGPGIKGLHTRHGPLATRGSSKDAPVAAGAMRRVSSLQRLAKHLRGGCILPQIIV